jgi:hypothetical protein
VCDISCEALFSQYKCTHAGLLAQSSHAAVGSPIAIESYQGVEAIVRTPQELIDAIAAGAHSSP